MINSQNLTHFEILNDNEPINFNLVTQAVFIFILIITLIRRFVIFVINTLIYFFLLLTFYIHITTHLIDFI